MCKDDGIGQAVHADAAKGRGVCLFSGGLDSQLAVCVLREQGVHVEGVVFESPFFRIEGAQRSAAKLNLTLHEIPFTADILELVQHPRHGFGGALNPCIDCHARMIQRAGEWMTRNGFDFVATGEVLNQRPLSQTRHSLAVVERDAALDGRLLRPLSALLLEPTLPETLGLVDRTRLLGLNGRSRKPQMELAARYGLKEYPAPAGGCLLTEKGFCRKLTDLQKREGLDDERLVRLLTIGRHFRLPGSAKKCVMGRDARENALLQKIVQPDDLWLHTVDIPGPTVLIPLGADDTNDRMTAAALCAAYGDHQGRSRVTVRIHTANGIEDHRVVPMERERGAAWLC
ncbi:MAG TPA: tRNA 4-thiouridine(8) synthase ThiI [Kiritimatiellia bacterium]|jgi:hypothetical protein|nr:tRNA 4-thiouridine(8) synthase ThiI [Kiritimatiellia bacterium]HOM58453.1 tRNA 4-thiouridine(8) synthase ThiI [Kiritimatiellia bacterium]HOR98441.1 tRNA 4-thiouridine(8) synthase ThiI [Kiritimatiellia bacterium]HPC49414.1 tRNA 4-thiouridine(8) synthase ThiI [Kiritimatiellia bacterium]HPK37905.1 tRNA 4-thiouridine(8) synthase ThiI [Kiritimatiellia bacterium]